MNGCKKIEYWVRQKKVREQFWVWDKPGACFAEGGGGGGGFGFRVCHYWGILEGRLWKTPLAVGCLIR